MEMTTNDLKVRVNRPLMNEAIRQLNNVVIPAEQYFWYNNWIKSGQWRSIKFF